MLHRLVKQLSLQLFSIFPVYLIKVNRATGVSPYYAIKIVDAVPTGTPDAAIAINIANGATLATRIYVDNAGVWAPQTT